MDSFKNIRKVLTYTLLLNWLVAATKTVLGLLTKSHSIFADGMHSFADGTSNIVGLIGIHFASQPVDKDHPYGHKKMETLTGVFIAMLLFVLAFEVIETSIKRFINPVKPEINILSFIVMALTIVINISVMIYEYKKGRALKSDILVSDSMHTRGDIFISFSVIASLILTKAGFPILDTIVSLFIGGFIAWTAIEILRHGSEVLVDKMVLDPKLVKELVLSIQGVRDCHDIRAHGRADDIKVDIRIHVVSDMRIDKAHDISLMAEKTIKEKFEGVTEVLVHVEPESKHA